ncbi:ABC transporter ATP-binding protein [Natrarchaeobius oligotrophus]|uniref:ABC-type D-xylose/L-arabinose transporter n=1 Tax=Natrarchaeobius chitinivorans TaxID=1679083 RepID=A0A3N6MS97_NATCH|nr:ABC transporter ATP-binding protein [Natrarchaeobius chitinivorans]RQG99171.1 ABC transporter ATP-binding protein [Natrarchaeobius chitinivorans]
MVLIQATDLTKQYNDVVAVDGIDFEIRDKELLVLVGPSGCGKSSTLRLLAGLEDITDGELRMDGKLVNDVSPKDRNVSMVFQNYALFPHMSARRNMTFGMKSRGSFDDEEIDERVREAAELLGIEDLLDRKPGELSGGEKQRVAIGRAIVRDPDVFLLDEPLSNLDAKLKTQMRAELATVHDDIEATTIYVTHDQTEAMSLGDRIAVMNNGEIQQIGDPQTVYDYPTNQFVAEFIGNPSMNVLPVEVDEQDSDFVARHEQFELTLPKTDSLTSFGEGTAKLGIRPEDFSLSDDGDDQTMQVDVNVVEPLGDALLVYCSVGTHDLRVWVDNPRQNITSRDTLTVSVDEERLHLFDDATGENLYHSDDTVERDERSDDISIEST